ncbi:MAG: hypothetical protein HYX59_14720 [Elusimicrobia bacterium]|nr:hypothetical protein [Elusimicrobiota bacterium]
MIPSTLRRTLLALAVIAFLISRASAQTDAAFATALQLGAPTAVQFAQAKAKPQKPAPAPKAPVADDAVWQKVLETVKRDGVYKPGNGPLPGAFTIDDSSGDPKGARVERSVAVLGMINDDEQFEAMGAIFVVKSYTLDPKDGNFRVDQWMFMTDIYGEVGDGGHGLVIQTPDGKTVSAVPEKLSPSDPRIQAQYDAMIKYWAERAPKGA